MSNMPPFQVGGSAIYVGNHPKIPKWTKCTVMGLNQLQCGCWIIKVEYSHGLTGLFVCGSCGDKRKFFNDDDRWWMADNFRPVQEQKFPLIEYKKVLEEVPVGAN